MKLLTAASLALIAAATAQAAHPVHKDHTTVHYVGAAPDSAAMTEAIIANAPEQFSSPGLPRFVAVGSSGKFAIGVGGFAKGTVSFDFGDVIDNPTAFITSQIPTPRQPGNGGKFQFGIGTSTLYVNAVATPDNGHNVGAFVAVNFLGKSLAPALQYAYVNLGGIQLGYNYSLFADMGAAPPTIDFEGPNAYPVVPTIGVRYTRSFGPNGQFRAGAAIEKPEAGYTLSAYTARVFQRIPDLPLFFRWSWQHDAWVRLSAIVRGIQYRDLVSECNRTVAGWGFALTGTSPLGSLPLTLYWDACAGQGISTIYQDLAGTSTDLMPWAGRDGRLRPVTSWGGYAALQWNINSRLFASAYYSQMRLYARRYASTPVAPGTYDDNAQPTPWGEQYRYAQQCAANIFYRMTSYLQCGMEYDYGRRVNMDGSQGHDSRVQLCSSSPSDTPEQTNGHNEKAGTVSLRFLLFQYAADESTGKHIDCPNPNY